VKKFSKWANDGDLHNQLNRLVSDIQTQFAQIPAAATPAPVEAAAASQGGGIGAASSAGGGPGVEAGTGITTTPTSGGVMVSNAGVTGTVASGQGLTVSGATGDVTITINQKAQRITTGSILASATTPVTLTWTTPFGDANYTPIASVVDSSGFLAVVDIASFSATQVIVNVINNDASNPHTGTLCALALHD
jgi:hypothetical protein